MAWTVRSSHGREWNGEAGEAGMVRPGKAGQGGAWPGWARPGRQSQEVARMPPHSSNK
jgi:hypothetical protein